ncbi:MAG: hypothetical protein MRY64_09140 [Hyphomonadaceae bacterium]|nr:hypothetical protein [Hyphomonadaceae bacterium]
MTIARYIALLLAFGCLFAGSAEATRLEVAEDAPFWAHLGAAVLLWAHIGGGVLGLLSGVAAIASRKGSRLHRLAGKIFFVSMFVTYAIGAGVAPFLPEGQRPNFVAGIMALYLLISGVLTVQGRGRVSASWTSYAGLASALAITAMGATFMYMGANSETGTVDGSPPQAFILFMVAGSFAAIGELNLILRRSLAGAARLARHLWRMCFSMFLASGSLFLGQPQVFPDWFHATTLPIWLAFAPLLAMLVWLVLVRLPRRKRMQAA